jgi:cytochrome c553
MNALRETPVDAEESLPQESQDEVRTARPTLVRGLATRNLILPPIRQDRLEHARAADGNRRRRTQSIAGSLLDALHKCAACHAISLTASGKGSSNFSSLSMMSIVSDVSANLRALDLAGTKL